MKTATLLSVLLLTVIVGTAGSTEDSALRLTFCNQEQADISDWSAVYSEVERLLGVEVQPVLINPHFYVVISLGPTPPNALHAMGMAIGKSAYIYVPNIHATLGHTKMTSEPRQKAELKLAMSRVIAHELLHLLFGEGHQPSGLMSPLLDRNTLLDKDLQPPVNLLQLVR